MAQTRTKAGAAERKLGSKFFATADMTQMWPGTQTDVGEAVGGAGGEGAGGDAGGAGTEAEEAGVCSSSSRARQLGGDEAAYANHQIRLATG